MKKIALGFSIAMFGFGYAAHAGAISGGGDKGVICRAADGSITSATTLDLYEGQVVYGLKVVESLEPVDVQVQKALSVIPVSSRGMMWGMTGSVTRGIKIVHGIQLQPVDDALIIAVPRGCQAEQLANYFDNDRILIDGDIWDKLSLTSRASLILHEGIYAAERVLGATNSQRTRHIVASLFDPSTKWTDVKDGIAQNSLTCVAKGTFFSAFQDSNKNWVLQFQILGSNQVMSKKVYTSAGANGFDFNEAKDFPVINKDTNVGESSAETGSVDSAFENQDWVTITRKWEAIKDQNGQIVPGYETPRYYLRWTSGTYPSTSSDDTQINCSVILNPTLKR